MQLRKTYKFRLYANRKNRYLHDTINCAGIAWNHITALQKASYRLGQGYISANEMKGHMAKLRRRGGRFAYLQPIGSQALQDVCERHDRTYQAFFKWVKQGGVKRSPPKFKKVKKYKSFTLKQAGWKLMGHNRIRIGNYVYKFAKSRNIVGDIKTVTIKRDLLGRLWLFFSVVQIVPDLNPSTGNIGGFDFGLKTYLTDHEGKQYKNPEFFKQGMSKIAKCNRSLARKKQGSRGYKKARRSLTKTHEQVANQRHDWQWKLAHELTSQYDALRFEDLNLNGMKRLWGRKVSDLAFADFLHKVEYLCRVKGKQFEKIDRWQPTSQCCSQCGARQKLSLAVLKFECAACGLILDRDHNAAVNIQAGGASPARLGDVRRVQPAVPV